MIHVDPKAYCFWALLILTVPLQWLAGAVSAAAVHELFHLAAISAFGGKLHEIHLGITGAQINAEINGIWPQLLSSLCGPLGSFLMLFLCRIWPEAAICGFFQGIFNLLPIYPLDGGRMLHMAAEHWMPGKARDILIWTETILCFCLMIPGFFFRMNTPFGTVFIMASGILLVRIIFRKRPCKEG